MGKPPKSSHFNRVFHYFHHPFWGPTPIFGNIHIYIIIYIPRKSKSTKLCPLVGSGILCMNHPKHQPATLFGRLDFQGIYICMPFIYIYDICPNMYTYMHVFFRTSSCENARRLHLCIYMIYIYI